MTGSGREQRLIQRIKQLHATDPQFRAAAPLVEVTDAAHQPGLRLWEVVEKYLNGYSDRPAVGQRACESQRDETTGRTATAATCPPRSSVPQCNRWASAALRMCRISVSG